MVLCLPKSNRHLTKEGFIDEVFTGGTERKIYSFQSGALQSAGLCGKIPSGGRGTGGACRVYDQPDGGGNPRRSL